MTQAQRIRGVLAPVVTPFNKDLSPDPERLIAQCKWMLTQNCGLAVFGTNSEANSLSVNERIALLDALLAADVDPARMMPGTGCCALTDTVRLTEHAVKAGCAGVLMLPPFYYKGVTDEGLFRYFSEVIERVGDERLRIYLYHIPPVSQVPITLKLIGRLLSNTRASSPGRRIPPATGRTPRRCWMSSARAASTSFRAARPSCWTACATAARAASAPRRT